ncbi:hypothetical protein LCM19_06260 [Qipengyuania flava]|nr:hypothetical protein [Qipengyuania flava]
MDFARELEQFDGLLRFWFRKAPRNGTDKIDIYLMDNDRQVARLLDWRGVAGFYSPEVEGTYAVAHRGRAGMRSLDGQTAMFHEYAHHFMYNEFSVPIPAWLREGFAEFLATTEFDEDGSWTYGKPASHRGTELRRFDDPQIERLLSWPQKNDDKRRGIAGFYGWSWALTHMLYTDPDQGARITAYIDRLAAGEDSVPAAEAVFGDLKALERRLRSHVGREIEFAISTEAFPWSDKVEVTELGIDESRMLELRLRRRGGGDLRAVREDLVRFAEQGDVPADAYAELAMAELELEERNRWEHRDKNKDDQGYEELAGPWFPAAEVAADKALAIDPDHVYANIVKGRILLYRLVEEDRPGGHDDWKEARRYLQVANRADPDNSEALYRFAHSFTQEKREGSMMFDAYGAAFIRAPQVRTFRIALAYDLARLGRHDEGIALLQMLANDPHYPEAGQKAVERIEAMRKTGAKFPPELAYDEEENGRD